MQLIKLHILKLSIKNHIMLSILFNIMGAGGPEEKNIASYTIAETMDSLSIIYARFGIPEPCKDKSDHLMTSQ